MSPALPALPSLATVDRLEGLIGELVVALHPAPPATAPARGRPPVLPGLLLWSGLLVCVLRGFSSQLALWRLLTATGLWHFPKVAISDDGRLQAAGAERTGGDGAAPHRPDRGADRAAGCPGRPHPGPFAREVYAIELV